MPPQRMAWLLMTLPLLAALLLLFGQQLAVLLVAAAVLGLATGSDGCLAPSSFATTSAPGSTARRAARR